MSTDRVLYYSLYERLWHWFQAVGMLLLMLTGVVLHAPDWFGVLPLPIAVHLHNGLGFLLIANAFLGFFFYLTTGTIRQHLPVPRDFLTLSMQQSMYYLRGIFRGDSHPLARTAQRRLNPLQQVTYLVILNILLPAQIVSGLWMWGGQRWPGFWGTGGLAWPAMIHTAVAWLFAAFLIAHVYLTTTGHTPWSHLRAMVSGYEERLTIDRSSPSDHSRSASESVQESR